MSVISSILNRQSVGKKNNIIEINGKRYDARTGDVLGPGHTPVHTPGAKHQPKQRSVDGFVKPAATHTAQPIAHHTAAPKAVSAAEKQAILDREQRQALRAAQSARKVAAHATKAKPQHTNTLMRSTVSKPAPSFKRNVKAQAPVSGLVAQPSNALAHKVAAHSVHPRRNAIAKKFTKSPAITRFGSSVSASPSQHYANPVAVPTASAAVAQAYAAPTQAVPHVANTVKPAHSHSDLFQNAIKNATSHTQPAHKVPSRHRRAKRIAGVSASIVTTVALFAVVITQNMTDIKLQLASARAGITASLPAERPAGFRTSNISYEPGAVTLSFVSNSDQRAYSITENTSNWDSEALRENYVTGITTTYQTVQSGGRTIYLLGDGQATWVNGGVWYKVLSHGTLNNRQLVDIATSM